MLNRLNSAPDKHHECESRNQKANEIMTTRTSFCFWREKNSIFIRTDLQIYIFLIESAIDTLKGNCSFCVLTDLFAIWISVRFVDFSFGPTRQKI